MNKQTVITLVMLGLAARVEAQLQKGDQLLSVQAGFAVPLSDLEFNGAHGDKDTFADAGGSFGIQYYYHILPMLGVGLELSDSIYSDRTSNDLIANTSSVSGGHSFDVIPVVRCAFLPEHRVHPFVEGGLGVSNTALKIESTPDANHVWANSGTREKRTLFDSTESGAAFLIGGGVDFFINEHFFIGASSRFLIYGRRTYDATDSGLQSGFDHVKGTLATYNMLFRAGWKF